VVEVVRLLVFHWRVWMVPNWFKLNLKASRVYSVDSNQIPKISSIYLL